MPFEEYSRYREAYRGPVTTPTTQAPEGPTMAPEGLGVPEATQTPPERQTPQIGSSESPELLRRLGDQGSAGTDLVTRLE